VGATRIEEEEEEEEKEKDMMWLPPPSGNTLMVRVLGHCSEEPDIDRDRRHWL
jgi:hypothetical protein